MIKKLLSVFMGFFSGLFAVIRGNLPKQDDCGVRCDIVNHHLPLKGEQFISDKKFSKADICRAFQVPEKLLCKEWKPWEGGECPVESWEMVFIMRRNGVIEQTTGGAETWWHAVIFSGQYDILAWRYA